MFSSRVVPAIIAATFSNAAFVAALDGSHSPVMLAARRLRVHASVARRDSTLLDLESKFTHYVLAENPFAAFNVLKSIEARVRQLR